MLLHYVALTSTIFHPIPPVYVIDLVSKTQVAAFWRGSMPFVTRACLVGATQVGICLGEGIERFHLKSFASCKLWLSGVFLFASLFCHPWLQLFHHTVLGQAVHIGRKNPHTSRKSHADLDQISHMWTLHWMMRSLQQNLETRFWRSWMSFRSDLNLRYSYRFLNISPVKYHLMRQAIFLDSMGTPIG